jgi:DNA-binding CsgD family transcriptional regulator
METIHIICSNCNQHPGIYDKTLRCQCFSILRKDIGTKSLYPHWQVSVESLSPRQYEVVLLLSKGYSISQIATTIGITRTTIKNHLGTAKKRLNVSTSWELVARVAVEEYKRSVLPEG